MRREEKIIADHFGDIRRQGHQNNLQVRKIKLPGKFSGRDGHRAVITLINEAGVRIAAFMGTGRRITIAAGKASIEALKWLKKNT